MPLWMASCRCDASSSCSSGRSTENPLPPPAAMSCSVAFDAAPFYQVRGKAKMPLYLRPQEVYVVVEVMGDAPDAAPPRRAGFNHELDDRLEDRIPGSSRVEKPVPHVLAHGIVDEDAVVLEGLRRQGSEEQCVGLCGTSRRWREGPTTPARASK